MTDDATPVPSYEMLFEHLTAPGAVFEIGEEDVNGVRLKHFVRRPPNLAILLEQSTLFAERPCMIYGQSVISYSDFASRVRRLAATLRNHAKFGERVAILGANHPDWVVTLWACLCSGLVPVALNGWWKAKELIHGLTLSGAKLIVGDQRRLSKLDGHWDQAPSLTHCFCWDAESLDTPFPTQGFATLDAAVWSPEASIAEDHPAALIFTSGTTGRAKAAIHTHGSWIAALMNTFLTTAIEVGRHPEVAPDDGPVRMLASLPFFHVGGGHGTAVTAIVGGQTIIIPDRKFDPAYTLDLIERHRIQRWSAVPAMVAQTCAFGNLENRDLSSLVTLGYGAAPSGASLQARAHALFSNLRAISNAYGLTETGGIFAMNTGRDLETRPASVGRPFATADLRIVDEDENTIAVGKIGEIQVRGPFLMAGYWDDPGATSHAFAPGGWLRTGDLGHLDTDGFLYIDGRRKDIIIRGGENILAEEVELRLTAHHQIREAAVVPVPSEHFGEEVKAIVVLESGASLSADEIRAWVREALADFKVPAFIEFRTEPLPRNATGKIMKAAIASQDDSQFDEFF